MVVSKFLIVVGDSENPYYCIVNAINENEAENIFSEFYALKDASFLENIADKSWNFSFAEQFCLKTDQEQDHFLRGGGIMIDEDTFKERIFDYFHPHPEFAKIYIDYYFSEEKTIKDFSKEMIVFMWKKETVDSKWCEVKVLNLNSMDEIGDCSRLMPLRSV